MKKHIRDAILSVKEAIDNGNILNKNITDLANDAGIGRNLLQKGFKLLFHSTIKEYRIKLCLEKAKKMLEEGRLTRKQIAYRSGYKTPCNFGTAFKKAFGISPMEYRNKSTEVIAS